MILNLKDINQFIQPVHFRMETLAAILPILKRVDWAVSIDLSDAYHHVPIARPSRRLLGFSFAGQGVPIQSPPLRPKARPPAVHPADFSGCGLPPGTRHKGVLLFRRLADRRRHPTPPHSTPGFLPWG